MSITKLYRAKTQPTVTTTEASTQATESWQLETDVFSLPIEVDLLVRALTTSNAFGFSIIGQVHPNNASLVVTKIVVSRTDDTYTKHILTTTLTNNKATINSSVKPSRAQDSYSFSHADVEVIVSESTYASKSTTATLKAGAGASIENTNGRGIIALETKSIIRAVIVRNEDDYSLKKASAHVGKVNQGSVTITGSTFKAGTCKLIEWAGADAYDSDGKLYWRVTYEILITDDPAFFERDFIMRGVVDGDGKAAEIALGYISEVEYKLEIDGSFMSKADQKDPTKFVSKSFATLGQSSWGPAVRLQTSPNPTITTLTGESSFGLIKT